MKQVSLFFLAIAFTGILITGCSNNNPDAATTDRDSVTTFDLNAMKKTIEEKEKHNMKISNCF